MVRQRIRLRFSKSGNLKYIGHKDLLRTFEALFRRARVPLAMSGGFHPKIRMSLPSALALGIEGFDEVLELEMNDSTETVDADELLVDLNRCSINGLEFLAARLINEGEKKAKLAVSVYEVVIPPGSQMGLADRIRSFLSQTSVLADKPNGKRVDVRKALVKILYEEHSGRMRVFLAAQDGPEAGIREVLQVLELENELFKTVFPKRIQCRLFDRTSNQDSGDVYAFPP